MEIGVFIPIGNNGWLISETAPQYKPSYELNLQVVQTAEKYGFEFALSMVKLRGFGGKTEFWDHNLESFTLMSAIAAATSKIKLYASTAILAYPPDIVARMATTIDYIAPGRFGVNMVTGWQMAEYSQMGMWPGNAYFGYRYEYATEYVQVLKDLWKHGVSNFKGKYFTMNDCRLSPRPSGDIKIVAAGQSPRGIEFAADYADFNFTLGSGINTPTAFAPANERLLQADKKSGRDVGSIVLFMLIMDETDEGAKAKWEKYRDGADVEALSWMIDQASRDTKADATSSAKTQVHPEGAINMNIGTLVGSYSHVAKMLDKIAEVPGTKGIMLIFDDWLPAMEAFGQRVQPLMKSREKVVAAL